MKRRTKRFSKCIRADRLEASFSGNCDIGGSGDIYTGDSDSGESGVGAGGSDISVSDIDDGSGGT